MPVEDNAFDDVTLAYIRANQEDPIVQYYIVRSDVPMTPGKLASQVAHGAMMFLLRYNQLKNHHSGAYAERLNQTFQWLNGSFRKVLLKGDTKDFERLKKELDVFLVRDAGLTEVDPNTETVLVTWPMLKSQRPKFLTRLRVL
jgi:peptidyl-tRNA hydrolase